MHHLFRSSVICCRRMHRAPCVCCPTSDSAHRRQKYDSYFSFCFHFLAIFMLCIYGLGTRSIIIIFLRTWFRLDLRKKKEWIGLWRRPNNNDQMTMNQKIKHTYLAVLGTKTTGPTRRNRIQYCTQCISHLNAPETGNAQQAIAARQKYLHSENGIAFTSRSSKRLNWTEACKLCTGCKSQSIENEMPNI